MGEPVASVKITAVEVQPIKGYIQFETETDGNGMFRVEGLFPSSAYILKPWSDKWHTETEVRVDSAPQGETEVLREAIKIDAAYSKSGGSLVLDLATGKTRFSVTSDGVIEDSETGLIWVTGPDRTTDYEQAVQWVAACQVAGGGWRIPTWDELQTLYQPDVGEHNMDQAFKTTGEVVWAESRDSSSARGFSFDTGMESGRAGLLFIGARVFGVRSLPR